jgi:glutathione S-transferase
MRDAQLQKIAAACDFVEQEVELKGSPDIGEIALATTLSWIAFRDVYSFGAGRPRLSSWYDNFTKRPSMAATTLAGETQD